MDDKDAPPGKLCRALGVEVGIRNYVDVRFNSTDTIPFCNNRCVQHRAMWDYWPHTRSGTRVTVKGERPV